MIKLNFEFDSKDPISSRFFDWLSAFPLEKSSVKVTTSVDYIDPSSDSYTAHRIGNIILEFSPDDEINTSNLTKTSGPDSTIEISQKSSDIDLEKYDQSADEPKSDVSQLQDINYSSSPSGSGSINSSVSIVSTEGAFESDLDESILAEVAFGDNNEESEPSEEIFILKDNSEIKTDKYDESYSEIKENVVKNQESEEDLDFLLDSLDEFNS